VNKIALGTAQFGLDYGIANAGGCVGFEDVEEILHYAHHAGIATLDTAIAYGESEKVLGLAGIGEFEVITKLPSVPTEEDVGEWVHHQIRESKQRLGVDGLKAVLLHRPLELLGERGGEIYDALQACKQNENVEKIGISVYQPSDVRSIIQKFNIDLIQLPYNFLDGRWETLFVELKQKEVEIHVRSVFLQGLLLMENKPAYFQRWSGLWALFDDWLSENQITPLEACLNYVLQKPQIDKLVVGVDSLAQLKQITAAVRSIPDNMPSELKTEDEMLLNPGLWRLDD
jgi:aryl-alcohol dehydrogenase-like predicted oxidoreductase